MRLLLGSCRTKFYIFMDIWAQYQLKKDPLYFNKKPVLSLGFGLLGPKAFEGRVVFIDGNKVVLCIPKLPRP